MDQVSVPRDTVSQDDTVPQDSKSPQSTVVTPNGCLTVVEMVYHQQAGGHPETAFGDGSRFSRNLKSDEQAYSRRRVATEEWKLLDCGWIEKCGMLLVKNNEGQFNVIPSPEELAQVYAEKVIELTYDPPKPQWVVFPNESMRACPIDASSLYIRCRCGTVCYNLYLLPE